MNKIFDYKNLTLNELIEKISTARFFHLPKMVAEAFKKLNSRPSYEPPYKVYTALLTQTGTDAPVATVLENTLGDIVWSRESEGSYKAILIGEFIDNKTYATIQQTSGQGSTSYIAEFSVDYITIGTSNPSDILEDNELDKSPFQIKLYV